MVYYPRKRYNKRYNKVPSNKQLAQKIKKLQNDEELKYKDTGYFVGQVEAADFTVFPVGLVGNGDDARARDGDIIRGTSLKMRFAFTFTPNNSLATTAFIRMIVFYARNVDGELPAVYNDINGLLDPNSASTPLLQMYNYTAMQDQFKVLYDNVITLESNHDIVVGATSAASPVSYFMNDKVKISRKQTYSGPNAVIGDLEANGIFVAWYFVAPNSETADEDQLVLEGTIRMYFKDD